MQKHKQKSIICSRHGNQVFQSCKVSFSRDSHYSEIPTLTCRPINVGGLINKGFKLLSQLNSWLPSPSHSYSLQSKTKNWTWQPHLIFQIPTEHMGPSLQRLPNCDDWSVRKHKVSESILVSKKPINYRKIKKEGLLDKKWNDKWPGYDRHLTPLLYLSSTPSLDTILAVLSREIKEQIFHICFYCFPNKLSLSFNLSSLCKHHHAQDSNTTNTSQNKHKNEKEAKKAGVL